MNLENKKSPGLISQEEEKKLGRISEEVKVKQDPIADPNDINF